MKKLLILFMASALFFACGKESTDPTTDGGNNVKYNPVLKLDFKKQGSDTSIKGSL